MMKALQNQIIRNLNHALLLSLTTLLFAFLPSGFAQDNEDGVFYFENRVAFAIASFNNVLPKTHFLGEELGKKDAVFHDLYSYTVSGQVTNTGQQVVIDKPIIFNSVKKTNRYYKQLLKKKQITEEEATEKVNHLLDVAISVYTQSTTSLEDELRKVKKPDEIAKIYESVILR